MKLTKILTSEGYKDVEPEYEWVDVRNVAVGSYGNYKMYKLTVRKLKESN